MMRLLPEERPSVYQYIHSICGITLDDAKTYLIEGRLGSLAKQTGCSTFSQLLARARSDPTRALERNIIDAITIDITDCNPCAPSFILLKNSGLSRYIFKMHAALIHV